MSETHFTGSVWFVTLVGLVVALGTQALIGALVPIAAFEWLYDKPPIEQVVLIAGKTSLWRVDTLIRTLSFGLGAFVACHLVNSLTWHLVASLMATYLAATALAQFPRPAAQWQLAVWASAAPAVALLVFMLYCAKSGDA
jgi:hypothetical protein